MSLTPLLEIIASDKLSGLVTHMQTIDITA